MFYAIGSLLMFLVGLFFYFLPSLIAYWRHQPNLSAIIILNFFLGWTFVGWVITLVWSFMK